MAVVSSRKPEVLAPDHPVSVLHGVGPATAARLGAAGLPTVRDLLLFFPRRVRELVDLRELCGDAVGRWVRVSGRIEGTSLRWLPRRRSMLVVRFRCDDGNALEVAIFNQPYLKHSFEPGHRRFAEGLLERRGARYVLSRGKILGRDAVPQGACQLRYPEIEGVSEQRLKGWIRAALSRIDLALWPDDPLPIDAGDGDLDIGAALRAMHWPEDLAQHEAARRHFALVEAMTLFRRVERARRNRLGRPGPVVETSAAIEDQIAASLPFAWTADQAAAVANLRARLGGPSPMGVLLQGEVGTGKTAVALYAALATAACGHQVAFLAPTELLAEQHAAVWSSWLQDSGVPVLRLTAGMNAAARRSAERALARPGPALAVGTHALFSKTTVFADLGLVIIDEQHRFGVAQRMELVAKGVDPHVLVMTATPIPRTLTLSLFGDLDVLVLRQRPSGRPPAPAVFVPPRRWRRVVRAIGRHVRRGGQVYVVCPKIGDKGERGGAVRLHRELGRAFAAGLLHGRMAPAARQDVSAAFRRAELEVLVGTTILEVGVDVPAASLMVIIGADRFGLATLHQLRGRVGRGRRRGLCILTGEPNQRAQAVCATTDGFALAEQDLRLRGAGELLGSRQSGLVDLRALDPLEDLEILRRARDAVRADADSVR